MDRLESPTPIPLAPATIKQLLCVMFDTLEVTRFVYKQHGVIHRDINLRTVSWSPTAKLYIPLHTADQKTPESLRFIGRGLDPSKSQWETNLLLSGFDESQQEPQIPLNTGSSILGTPVFVARSVLLGKTLGLPRVIESEMSGSEIDDETPIPTRALFCSVPSPSLAYEEYYPEWVKGFPRTQTVRILDHYMPRELSKYHLVFDAESVFWLLVYFVFVFQPQGEHIPGWKPTRIPHSIWECIHTNSVEKKIDFIKRCDSQPAEIAKGLDPHFKPLVKLIEKLARYFRYDRDRLTTSHSTHPMTHPEYVHEQCQRALFKFIEENQEQPWMTTPINQNELRKIGPPPLCPNAEMPPAIWNVHALRQTCNINTSAVGAESGTGLQGSTSDLPNTPNEADVTFNPTAAVAPTLPAGSGHPQLGKRKTNGDSGNHGA